MEDSGDPAKDDLKIEFPFLTATAAQRLVRGAVRGVCGEEGGVAIVRCGWMRPVVADRALGFDVLSVCRSIPCSLLFCSFLLSSLLFFLPLLSPFPVFVPVMSGEQRQKQIHDYTDEVAKLVPEYVKPIEEGHKPASLADVLANLLALEKKTRLAADARSTTVVCTALLNACWQCKDFKALNEHLSILTKRRAQLQKVIESVIQQGANMVKQVDVSTPAGEEKQRELIETLRTVSAGKMFVELERAQLTQILAAMEEKAGRVKEAADILQEIQVETIGSMDVQEKANYLLEQVRLVLLKKDFVRTEIIAKKLAVKQFNESDAKTNAKWQHIKIKYYKLMIEYHQHYSNYAEITKAYREIFNTVLVQADPSQWQDALSKLVIYGILSPWDAELSDLLHRISKEKKLEQLPAIKSDD